MSINVIVRIRHVVYSVRSLLASHRYIVAHHRVSTIRRLITVPSRSFPTSDAAHLGYITRQYTTDFRTIYKHWLANYDVLFRCYF